MNEYSYEYHFTSSTRINTVDMTESRTIISALRDTGTSRFIQVLVPDQLVPTVSKAIQIAEDSNSPDEAKKAFHTPRMISKGAHFSYTIPQKRPHYRPLLTSTKALKDLGLRMDSKMMEIINGEQIYYDKEKQIFPYSIAYAGFQFGQFAGQLGDGRVTNLFDVKDVRGQRQTLQIKGAGLTPFSRFADGKAVLRSSIREFIISEALHHIGIPSTRALQLTLLPKTRARRAAFEPCASVTRFAPSWIRLGNFNLFRWRQDVKGLVELVDFCVEEVFDKGVAFPKTLDINVFGQDFFPDEVDEESMRVGQESLDTLSGTTKYDLFFRHVVNLNAECVAFWQSYGFVNGVLNTDNTSIMGISMDFGPFSFLDKFQPQYTPNHDDFQSRYSFANQPGVVWWNLTKFAQDVAVLIGNGEKQLEKFLTEGLGQLSEEEESQIVKRVNLLVALSGNEYKFRFTTKYADIMGKRIGIDLSIPPIITKDNVEHTAEKVHEFTSAVLEPMLQILYITQVDYNDFFVNLQFYQGNFKDDGPNSINGMDVELLKVFFSANQVGKLRKHYHNGKHDADSGETRRLIDGCEMLSTWVDAYIKLIPDYETRLELSKGLNPLFTPRSYILEQVVDDFMENQRERLNNPEAKIDASLLEKLYKMSVNPYDSSKWDNTLRPEVVNEWTNKVSHDDADEHDEKFMKQCSCSS